MTLREACAGQKVRTIGTVQYLGDVYKLRLRYHAHGDIVEFKFVLMPGTDIPICVRFRGDKDFWEAFQQVMKYNLAHDAEISITATDVPHYVS